MPTYEYFCEHCKDTFDIRASIQEKDAGLNPLCPNCGNESHRQILSAGMFLRGGGATGFNPPNCGPSAGPGCCG